MHQIQSWTEHTLIWQQSFPLNTVLHAEYDTSVVALWHRYLHVLTSSCSSPTPTSLEVDCGLLVHGLCCFFAFKSLSCFIYTTRTHIDFCLLFCESVNILWINFRAWHYFWYVYNQLVTDYEYVVIKLVYVKWQSKRHSRIGCWCCSSIRGK